MQFYIKFLCQPWVCDRCLCHVPASPSPSAPGEPRAGPGPAGAEGWSLALTFGLSILFVRAPRAPRLWFVAVGTSVRALQVPFWQELHGELTLARGALPQGAPPGPFHVSSSGPAQPSMAFFHPLECSDGVIN